MNTLKKKISISTFTITQLLEYNLHIGYLKKFRNTTNSSFIYNTPQKLDIINIQTSLHTLKNTLPIITNILAKGGKILIIFNTKYKPFQKRISITNKTLKQKFLFSWKPGLLSNFKEFKKQKKYNYSTNIVTLPHFICFLTNYFTMDFKGEITKFNIPTLNLQNTYQENPNFLCTIPANNNTYNIKLFFLSLLNTTILHGYTKKILKFSHKKYILIS